MDFITSLPVTQSGYDSILTVVDRFSKFVILIPIHTTVDAADVARLFFDNVVCKYGMPVKVISDRDTKFTSSFW